MKIVKDMPNAEYHAQPELCCSNLKDFCKDPQLYKAYKDGATRETNKYMELGTYAHCALLEPQKITELVAEPKPPYKGEGAKKRLAEWRERNEGKLELNAFEVNAAQRACDYIKKHPEYGPLVDQKRIVPEYSIFWQHEGLPCRCRPDALAKDLSYYVAVKTVYKEGVLRNARKAAKHSGDMEWPLEVGFYALAISAVREAKGLDPDDFSVYVLAFNPLAKAIRSNAAMYRYTGMVLETCKCHAINTIARFREYDFDAPIGGMIDIDIPSWYWEKHENQF